MSSEDFVSGSQEAMTKLLKEEQVTHKPHAHKMLDLAYDLVILVNDIPAYGHDDFIAVGGTEELWRDMQANGHNAHDFRLIDKWLGEQYLAYHGTEIETADKFTMQQQIMDELASRNFASSNCAVWHWAHVLEHLLWRELN